MGINIGVEVDGKNEDFERPVLILKWINKGQFLGIPLTSSSKGYFYKKLKYNEHDKEIFVNMSQLKILSSKRLLRKIGMVNEKDFLNLKKDLKEYYFE